MRTLIASLLVLFSLGQAQELAGKYQLESEDGLISVFLDPRGTELAGGIMFGYGLFFPISGTIEGNTFTAQLPESQASMEGEVEGDTLTLVFSQDDERQTWRLARQRGEETVTEAALPLLRMLALTPDDAIVRERDSMVGYVNYEAIRNALIREQDLEGIPEDEEAVIQLMGAVIRRAETGPTRFRFEAQRMQAEMPELVGFTWHDVKEGLSYGVPPYDTNIFAVDFDADELVERLSAREFEETERRGVTVWHRHEDGQQNIRQPEMDPFVGVFGRAARIAVLPDYLLNSPFWFVTERLIDTHTHHYPSLAQAADFRTLADALTSTFDGELYQVQFMGPLTVGVAVGDPFRALEGEDPVELPASPLPIYGLVALADFRQGEEQTNVIALLYHDLEAATLAAETLTERVAQFDPAERFATWGVRIDEPRVYESDSGLAAAIAAVRFSQPLEENASVLRIWLIATERQEFTPLAVFGGADED